MRDSTTPPEQQRGTIMLVSGEFDKALIAFELATGLAAMGMEIDMWFTLYGVNCLRKKRSRFSLGNWLMHRRTPGTGRNSKTDTALQGALTGLNPNGPTQLPLSQLNFFGAGPWLLRTLMKRKGMASLEQLILSAEKLGIRFKICQPCIDIMAVNVEEDLIVQAEVLGVSTYALDIRAGNYNVVI